MSKLASTSQQPTAPLWRCLASVLALLLLVLSLVAYNLISTARTEAANARAALEDARGLPQAVPVNSPSSTVTAFDHALANAKSRPGTQEALDQLNNKAFDVLQANLLIAQGIPTAKIDHELTTVFYDQLADEIRQHMDAMRLTPEGQAYIAEKGEPEFKMACANEVITAKRKIAYVANDQVDATQPWHLFAHGIADKNQGTCVTMALMWKIVADKLGWPMQLRNAPTHLYLAWDDGTYKANLEATDSAKPVSDEEYRKREKVSLEDQQQGRYMRDLTPKEMLAAFVSTRAFHWHAVRDHRKEFDDLLLAVELDPKTPSYRINLYKAWQKVRGLLENECEKLVGAAAVATVKCEELRRRSTERALAEAEAQKALMRERSGIPDVRQVTNSPMYTGHGWEYNPKTSGVER